MAALQHVQGTQQLFAVLYGPLLVNQHLSPAGLVQVTTGARLCNGEDPQRHPF
jgi:hypothetical protein